MFGLMKIKDHDRAMRIYRTQLKNSHELYEMASGECELLIKDQEQLKFTIRSLRSRLGHANRFIK